jgi:hypothetical protein
MRQIDLVPSQWQRHPYRAGVVVVTVLAGVDDGGEELADDRGGLELIAAGSDGDVVAAEVGLVIYRDPVIRDAIRASGAPR